MSIVEIARWVATVIEFISIFIIAWGVLLALYRIVALALENYRSTSICAAAGCGCAAPSARSCCSG